MNDASQATWCILLDSAGPDDTVRIGRCIGSVLLPGDVVALVGPLGAGKTQIAKGLSAGAGFEEQKLVNSPTFVLVNEYPGRWPIFHMDAYRLGSVEEFVALGLDEMKDRGIVLLEWADKVASALDDSAVWLELTPRGPSHRRIRLRTCNADAANRLRSCGLDRWLVQSDKP